MHKIIAIYNGIGEDQIRYFFGMKKYFTEMVKNLKI